VVSGMDFTTQQIRSTERNTEMQFRHIN